MNRRGSEGSAGIILPLLAAVAVIYLALPLIGLLIRTPWREAAEQLIRPDVVRALRLSLLVSCTSVALSLVFGFPLAWVLARHRFRGRNLVRTIVVLPMVLPPIVGGVALLSAFGRNGLLGGPLARLGIHLPFTTAGAVLAVTFVSAPFLVLSLEAGLNSLDRRLEDAAATLGASGWRTIRAVVIPALGPSLLSGIALAWARALGEFGATIAFAGNMPGRTQTLPLAIYETLHTDLNGAILLSVLLLAVSVCVMFALRGRIVLR